MSTLQRLSVPAAVAGGVPYRALAGLLPWRALRLGAASLLLAGALPLAWGARPPQPVEISAATPATISSIAPPAVPAERVVHTAPPPPVVRKVEEPTPATAVIPTAQASPQTASPAGSGEASYYAQMLEGRPTASGEVYRGTAMTAAHRTLPFGTRLKVTNLVNGRSVVVRVNDRGPFARQRVLDLSRAAAADLGMLRRGHAPVRLEILAGRG